MRFLNLNTLNKVEVTKHFVQTPLVVCGMQHNALFIYKTVLIETSMYPTCIVNITFILCLPLSQDQSLRLSDEYRCTTELFKSLEC